MRMIGSPAQVETEHLLTRPLPPDIPRTHSPSRSRLIVPHLGAQRPESRDTVIIRRGVEPPMWTGVRTVFVVSSIPIP